MELFDSPNAKKTKGTRWEDHGHFFLMLQDSEEFHLKKSKALLADTFKLYPEKDQKELRGRFQSKQKAQQLSAIFELMLFRLFHNSQMDIGIHQSETSKKPDFILTDQAGNQCIVEATLIGVMTPEEQAAKNRIEEIDGWIDNFPSPFRIDYQKKKQGKAVIKKRRLLDFFKSCIEDINRGSDPVGSIDNLTLYKKRYSFKENDWHLEFRFRRKNQAPLIPTLGIRSSAGWSKVTISQSFRKAIESKKPSHYGIKKIPYIIALMDVSSKLTKDLSLEALYGDEAIRFNFQNPENPEHEEIIKMNGVWTSNLGPTNQDVSAVSIFHGLLPWEIHNAWAMNHINPWAHTKLGKTFLGLPFHHFDGDQFQYVKGKPLQELFSIPPECFRPRDVGDEILGKLTKNEKTSDEK